MTLRSSAAHPRRAAARRSLRALFASLLVVLGVIAAACGRKSSADPFVPPASAGAGGEGASGGEGGQMEVPEDPELGGPCVDDPQCDDGFECTADSCDRDLARCRHVTSDALCDDGVYCNGVETCSRSLGCRAGAVVSCSDLNLCSIDTCIEETQSCLHEPRDADGDGDPTFDCSGSDCDDLDPLVSGDTSERCDNERDDDCDGEIDESDCSDPQHDRCGDALEIEESGSYELSFRGAGRDYPVDCQKEVEDAAFRDLVIAIVIPDGEERDVSVVAMAPEGRLVLAATEQCGGAEAVTECALGVPNPDGVEVTRLYFHGLSEGAHALYLSATSETIAVVRVDFLDPTPAPENETCATATELVPNEPVRAVLAGIEADIESACPVATGDLVYAFELEEPADVRISAVSLDGHGTPVISLRSEACAEPESELTCRYGSPRELFARALPAGSYRVGLFGTGPTEAEIALALSEPTEPLPGEGCEGAPELEFGATAEVTLSEYPDTVQIGCLVGAPDAAFSLSLSERSDVLLWQRGSDEEVNSLLFAEGSCTEPADALACRASEGGIRTRARDVGPGTLRAVVESGAGKPVTLTALKRPATSTVLVPLADECEDAVLIPEQGGRFEGTTRNAFADYTASCDYGGSVPPGAADQMLRLELDEPRRVVFDMGESSYDTLLVVRDASSCPGSEIERACSPGYSDGRSFLDIELAAGEYWVQIDGYNGESGRWVLDVFSSELAP